MSILDEPIIKLVDDMIRQAIEQRASDIHIEPFESHFRIRFRIDGLLYEYLSYSMDLGARFTLRLKVMAKLDIAERRLPQDGRFKFKDIDVRLNTCPMLCGEKIVLRILDAKKMVFSINNLGFLEMQKTIFLDKITQSQGLILMVGPTGSGKTVTLYSALNYLNNLHRNIATVEDPVEIQLTGINQVNIHPKIGLTFASALRAMLRQDPDILMIGEIRDNETAEIAIQAAHTGHLVFASLHCNNALEAISRFNSLGISNYHLAQSLSLVIAQRLLRKICATCIAQSPTTICKICIDGYQGRTAIYELLPMTGKFKIKLSNNVAVRDTLLDHHYLTLRQAANVKIEAGITNLREVERVLCSSYQIQSLH